MHDLEKLGKYRMRWSLLPLSLAVLLMLAMVIAFLNPTKYPDYNFVSAGALSLALLIISGLLERWRQVDLELEDYGRKHYVIGETAGKIRAEVETWQRLTSNLEGIFGVLVKRKVEIPKLEGIKQWLEALNRLADSLKFFYVHFEYKTSEKQDELSVEFKVNPNQRMVLQEPQYLRELLDAKEKLSSISKPAVGENWGIFLTLLFLVCWVYFGSMMGALRGFFMAIGVSLFSYGLIDHFKKTGYKRRINSVLKEVKILEAKNWLKEVEEENRKIRDFVKGVESLLTTLGLSKFVDRHGNVKWGMPEEIKKWELEDFEKEQIAKGLVKYEGQWITPAERFEREQIARGLVKFVDRKGNVRWGKPAEVKEWKKIDIGMQNNFADLSPREFEEFVADLFTKMGFQTELTPYVKDYGADIIAKRGKDSVLVQVKKYERGHNVGARDVQRTLGSMWKYKANKSILVTTSDFTVEAEEQSKEAPIELWNREKLYEMIERHYLKAEEVTPEKVEN